MNDILSDDYLYTLHPDFELSSEWLVEVIKKGSLDNDLLEEINNFLDEYKLEELTENDIDDHIKEELEYLNYQYNMGDITDAEYKKYKAEINNREKVKKQLEKGYLFGYVDALAVAEYLVALDGHPTIAFKTFLRNNSIENEFEKLKHNNSLVLFKNILSDISDHIFPDIKKSEIIDFLGVLGKENKQFWLRSVTNLETNMKKLR
jgi:ribosomal protein L21E